MKKLFISFFLCLFSIAAYSGAPTCRVYGTNTIATISGFSKSKQCTEGYMVTVSLTERVQSNVAVVVELYQDGNFVGSSTITICSGQQSDASSVCIKLNNNYNPNGGRVTAEIATASCQ